MRILNIQSEPVASLPVAAAPAAPPVVHQIVEPGVTQEQFASLENIARSLLKKLDAIEERLSALEASPARLEKSASPAELPEPTESSHPAKQVVRSFPVIGDTEPQAPVVVPMKASTPTPAPHVPASIPKEVENIRKELFSKMWKYMTDEPSKTI